MNHTTQRILIWLVATCLILVDVTANAGNGYSANQNYNNDYHRGDYGQNPYATNRGYQASRPAGSSVSASGSTNYPSAARTGIDQPSSWRNPATNPRTATRNRRSTYQIAHDYPPSNSPNSNKRAHEEQLRALAEKPGLPAKQRKWIMTRYNHIDNRRDEIKKADQRNQAKTAKASRQTSSLAGKE